MSPLYAAIMQSAEYNQLRLSTDPCTNAQSIDIDGETTAIGIIARLEHVLDRMEAEIDEQRRRAIDAEARLPALSHVLARWSPCNANWM